MVTSSLFTINRYTSDDFGVKALVKIRAVKWFFRVTKRAVFRYDYEDHTYRLGMDYLTSFLGFPRRRIHLESLEIAGMKAEWVTPDNIENDRVIMYIHGGAYNHGSIKSHRNITTRLALECKCKVLAFEYRLAPEFPFPAALDDTVKVYSYLRLSGIAAEKIVFCGDSAGGGLTLATLVRLRDNDIPLPMAAVCFSPWADLEASHPDAPKKMAKDPMIDVKAIRIWGKKYADGMLQHPLAAPKYAKFDNICPVLIQVGEDEVLYYDTISVLEKFNSAGVSYRVEQYEEMIHVFQMFAGFLPQADYSLNNVATFIDEVSKLSLTSKIS